MGRDCEVVEVTVAYNVQTAVGGTTRTTRVEAEEAVDGIVRGGGEMKRGWAAELDAAVRGKWGEGNEEGGRILEKGEWKARIRCAEKESRADGERMGR